MGESKHASPTQGPYFDQGPAVEDDDGSEMRVVRTGDGKPVAYVPHRAGTYKSERDATSAIFRAAPLMLEALRKHRGLWDRIPTEAELRTARADFDAAIKAATGGEP